MIGIHIAQQKQYKVLSGIVDPQIRKNASHLPLIFYMEHTVEEARQKLLNGTNRDTYTMPPKEEWEKIIEREKQLYKENKERNMI